MKLTAQSIKKLDLPSRGYKLITDGDLPGFGIRVTANDVRSFVLTYTVEGRQRRLTIGMWPAWTATAARERAKELRRLIDQGLDPLGMEQQRRAAATFGDLAQEYLQSHAVNKKSGHVDAATLRRDVLPVWGHLKAEDIRRRDVIQLVEQKARAAPIAANRLLALVRKIFNWALSRDLLESNPCLQVKAPGIERERDRVLNATEIQKLWEGLETAPMSPEVKAILRLILITAQRPGEVCEMEGCELDEGWWTVPALKAKNGLAHRVPLSSLALEQLSDRATPGRWIFPSPRGDKPIHVAALSQAVRLSREHFGIDHFTPHDLRRTAASHMASAGVSRLVLQKILNHVETGVTKVYDRYGYDQEKRKALDLWKSELRAILDGKSEKVVAISRQRQDAGIVS